MFHSHLSILNYPFTHPSLSSPSAAPVLFAKLPVLPVGSCHMYNTIYFRKLPSLAKLRLACPAEKGVLVKKTPAIPKSDVELSTFFSRARYCEQILQASLALLNSFHGFDVHFHFCIHIHRHLQHIRLLQNPRGFHPKILQHTP